MPTLILTLDLLVLTTLTDHDSGPESGLAGADSGLADPDSGPDSGLKVRQTFP